MGKSSTISTAKTPKDVEKAYASAIKAVSMLGIKIAIKKPDMAKLEPMMKSSGANFVLAEDGPNIKVSVEAGSYKSVLGIHNVMAEKDAAKRVALLRSLVKSGFGGYQKALDEAEKAAKGPDQKEVDRIQKEIDAIKKEIARMMALRESSLKLTLSNVMSNAQLKKEFEAHCKSEHASENLDFLSDVNKGDEYLKKTYIGNKAPKQINIPSAVEKKIMAEGNVKKHAMPEILALLEKDNMKRFKAKLAENAIKPVKGKQAEIEKRGKELAKALSA